MPSQFSAIGFAVTSGEDLAALATSVTDRSETIDAGEGQYLKYAPSSGEQLWLQVKRTGDALGMNPHFAGKSAVPIGIEARVVRESHTPLDGTFLAWANPPKGAMTGGDYPFAFDCPDAATLAHLDLPVRAVVQIAAFAQQITVYADETAYDAAQKAQGQSFPSRSFIPSGLLSPAGDPIDPPEPHALFVGHIIEAEARRNTISGNPFWWALVDTLGGAFDVVIDPELLPAAPRAGNILSGWFWLSGRISLDKTPKRGWFSR